MNPLKYLLPSIVCVAFSLPLAAQEPELPGGEVDVIKSFEARLQESTRFVLKPDLPPLDTSVRRQDYNIVQRNLNVDYLPPKIRPLAMRGDDLPPGYRGYAKLGAGFPSALYADVGYNAFNQENFDLGINLFHHSANNNRNVENQRFAYTRAGLDGTYYFDQGFAVNGQLNYSRDGVSFYGYNAFNEENDTDLSFAKDDVAQRFSTFSGRAAIFNGERTEADFNYNASLDFYFMDDNYRARERGFNLEIAGTKWFDDRHPLSIKLRTDFTSFRDSTAQSLNNFFLQPSYTYHGDVFQAKVGANIASHEDEFSFFPDLELSATLVEGVLSAFVGATGTLQKNNFRNLSDYNPFILSEVIIENTRYYQYYGGVRGNYQGIDFRGQVNYKTSDDLALFLTNLSVNDTIPRFAVLYDTVDIFNITGTVTAPLFEGLQVSATVGQTFYSLKNQEKAWHLPSFTFNGGASYTTPDKMVTVRGEFYLENGVPYQTLTGEAANLNALFDVSVGAEYRFSDYVGAFLQLNNLANNRRERWNYYPVFGLNGTAGIVVRFAQPPRR